jgi:hypothetical protein
VTQQDIEVLAMTGAATIVAAMATDAWATARDHAVELFRRHRSERQAVIEAQLDGNAVLVAQAGDAERARAALIGLWQVELETFLTRHPDSAGEVRTLTSRIQAALPAAQTHWVQHNTAHGHGIVNAVHVGEQHNIFMDSPNPGGGTGPTPGGSGESGA